MKINVENTDTLTATLEQTNGRATAHTLAAGDIAALARRVEKDLQGRGVPKKYLKGTSVTYSPSGPGKAYSRKYRHVISTRVQIERGSTCWFLTEAERIETWADSSERISIHITNDARGAILANALRDIIPSSEEVGQ